MSKNIIFPNGNGGVSVFSPAAHIDRPIESFVEEIVPQGLEHQIVDTTSIPSDWIFRDAWEYSPVGVEVSLIKAKGIAHTVRRALREKEFAPFDEVIMKQIPGPDLSKAEAERQKIRDKYAQMQIEIDAGTTPEQLKAILGV